MSPRAAKIFGDLKESPARAGLIMLAVLIGTAALLTALGARAVLEREITAGYAEGRPAAIILTLDQVDDALVAEARQQPGVVDAEARRLIRARAEVAPGDWRPLLLFGVRDFTDIRVSTIRREGGAWPPPQGTMLVERSALPVLNVGEGDALRIRMPDGSVSSVRVTGIVHDPAMAPGWQDNVGYAYVSQETLGALGQGERLDELRITVNGDRTEASRIASQLAEWASNEGRRVERIEVPTRRHPHADHMQTMLLLLSTFGALALVLSGALTANVVTGLLARQVRQIGVMKAVGARSGQIAPLYVTFVLALAIPGICIGVALGIAGARAFARFAADQLNLEPASFSIPSGALLLTTLFALAIALLATAVPLARALRITAREALQHVRVEAPVVPRTCPALGDRTLTLALRNSFRRPARLWLTLIALSLGGAALMMGTNVYGSLVAAVDGSLARRGDDLDVRLLRPVPAEAFAARVRAIPGVERLETWGGVLAAIELPGAEVGPGIATDRYGVLAPPLGTTLLKAPIVEGRWPTGTGEVAVNRAILARESTLAVGIQVRLRVGDRSVPVRIVGLVEEVAEPHFYTSPATFDALAGATGLAGAIRVVTEPGRDAEIAAAVEEVVVGLGSLPAFSMTKATLRVSMIDHFAILLALLTAAALTAISVGGLGLAASASLNVLERAREIGIMRAIGARRKTVFRVLLTEGFAVAAASVLLAVAIALPLSAAVAFIVGRHGLHADLPFVVQPLAIVAWIVLVTLITLLACLGPALKALSLPVRAVLSYE
jgi:putative ABC transport system permease protein